MTTVVSPKNHHRTVARVTGVAAALCAAAAGLATAAGTNAGALEQPRLTVTPAAPVVQQYAPLAGGGGGANVDRAMFVDPEICKTSAYCDTIPITVDASTLDPEREEWFVNFEVSWDTQVLEVPVYGDLSVNDLDTYIFNDPFDPKDGPDEDGVIGGGATGSEPEVGVLRNPNGTFFLVVSNYNGVNTGYTVTLEFEVNVYPTPFESLPPDSSGTPAVGRPLPGGPTFRPPAPPSFAGVPDPAFAPAAPAPDLSAGGDRPDGSFGEDPGTGSFEDAIAAPVTVAVSAPVPESFAAPSGLALVLWMLVLPLAVVAIGSGFLARRHTALLP